MTDIQNQDDFNEIVARFSTAEQSLGMLLDAGQRFQKAQEHLDDAGRSLESSGRTLADTASSVYGLATELKDTARDLKDTAIYFRALDPAEINRTLIDLVRTDALVSEQVEKSAKRTEALESMIEALAKRQRASQVIMGCLSALVVALGVLLVVV
jgi:hypothetical protein